jgi:2,4-dienoyl-CoA reductase-like NADH-dependent reductase (Old Yellow Enzyme family)
MRVPLEIFDRVRRVWPEEKPMSVRISATDWHPKGHGPEDAVDVARLLKEHGCDIVDVSAGRTAADRSRSTVGSSRPRSPIGSGTRSESPRWRWGTSRPTPT